MDLLSFSKIVNVLKIAYPYYFKDMSEESSKQFMQLYYGKLKGFRYETVANVINKTIEEREFMPSLAEVVKDCKNEQKTSYREKIQEMYKQGYFKTDEEYGKAMMWLCEDEPLVPKWLENDMKKITDIKLVEGNGKEQN